MQAVSTQFAATAPTFSAGNSQSPAFSGSVYNSTPSSDSFGDSKFNNAKSPQFGVLDGCVCSGPCLVGCGLLLAIPLLIAIKPFKQIGRLWNVLANAGKTVGGQIR